jgi:hypothetical protein
MSWTITPQQKTLNGTLTLGQALQGGYFAGYISHTADGNPTHALIVAPKSTGDSGNNRQWKTTITTDTGASSVFDGAANTASLVSAGISSYTAANFCVSLNIGGFTDWYLPARAELDIAYFNLKPTATANSTGSGLNIYAVPQRNSNNTAGNPAQVTLPAFASGGSEAFASNYYWSSTDSGTSAFYQYFINGTQSSEGKNNSNQVRAFRRIAL